MMDTIFILYADHEFNASTFAARVTASTLADMYAAVTSACGTLKGPLHGGANEESMKMLDDIKTPDRAEKWMMDALAKKAKIMGFGHRVYKKGDSRVPIMREIGRDLGQTGRARNSGSRFAKTSRRRWNARNTCAPMSISTRRRFSPCSDFRPGVEHADLRRLAGRGLVRACRRAARSQSAHSSALALHRTGSASLQSATAVNGAKLSMARRLAAIPPGTYAPNNACWGCGPANPEGLRIRSFPEGDAVVAEWKPEPKYEAFPGVLNGGIIGTLLDCHCNWTAAYHLMKQAAKIVVPCTVTADYAIKLLRPTPTKDSVHLSAKVVDSRADRATIEGTLSAGGKICATCRGTFVAVEGRPSRLSSLVDRSSQILGAHACGNGARHCDSCASDLRCCGQSFREAPKPACEARALPGPS